MDSKRWQRVEGLFATAIELPAEQRGDFIARSCGTDGDLLGELQTLLVAHGTEHAAIDGSPALGDDFDSVPAASATGTRLGPWLLGELLGQGGAGDVYLAERADGAFEQQVAIKVLRREAGGQLERFNAERQILARLEHPGIARLLDGGVTSDGRPYAVVEYVAGDNLVAHCRAHKLSLEDRLSLFSQVCEAVAYAHRNLIVHRDLKTGNILVTPEGRVKLLDFGIAKRLDVGTWPAGGRTEAPFTADYAAPEQLTGDPVTTVTDVYALGVLLFELLTDQRPWKNDGMPLARVVQLIVHDDAPLPSRIAAQRSTSGAVRPVAPRLIAGDLDAIVSKCLRKEPANRYSSVDELRIDLERHRRHAPVAARDRASLYVFGRWLRRNRWFAAAGVAVFASLGIGLGVAITQARQAALERDIAQRAVTREESVRYYLIGMFRTSAKDPGGQSTTPKTMIDAAAQRVLKQYRDDPLLAGKVVVTLSDLYGALQDIEGAVPLLEGFLAQAGADADPEVVAFAQQKLANVELLRGHTARAAQLLQEAEQFWARDPARFREQQLEGMFVRGQLQRVQGDLAGSIQTYQAAIVARTALSGLAHRETANLYNSLAITLTGANRMAEAFSAYKTALAIEKQLGLGDDLDALIMMGNTGTLAFRLGRLAEAEETLRTAIALQRARSGDSAAVAAALGLYGATQTAFGRYQAAIPVLQEASDLGLTFTGPASPLVIQAQMFLTEARTGAGDLAGARALADENLAQSIGRFGAEHLLTLRVRLSRANVNLARGAANLALPEYLALAAGFRKLGAAGGTGLATARLGEGNCLLALKRPAEAVSPLAEAVGLRQQLLWKDSWELAEARARLGEAQALTGNAGGVVLLRQAVVVLDAQLGAAHLQSQRARQALVSLTTG